MQPSGSRFRDNFGEVGEVEWLLGYVLSHFSIDEVERLRGSWRRISVSGSRLSKDVSPQHHRNFDLLGGRPLAKGSFWPFVVDYAMLQR